MATTNNMLNSLAAILESDGWDSMSEAGAEIEQLAIYGDFMDLTVVAQDGERKLFRVQEVPDAF